MQRRSSRIVVYVTSVLLFWFIAPLGAHAYIDPGSSSFIIQILIGAAAGLALAIATFWRRIFAFFSRHFGKDKDASPPPTSSTPPAPDSP